MIGNNSSGSESMLHGTTIDHVHALEVVLADGSLAALAEGTPHRLDDGVKAILREHARAISDDYPKHWRQSGGYKLNHLDPFNLAKLVCGSEGTLAVVTAATVGLVRLPTAKMFAVGHFEDVARAIAATHDALELEPSAVELIDSTILGLSRAKHEFRKLSDRLEGDPGALLFVSFSGDTQDEVRDKLVKLTRAWSEHGHGYHTLRAETAAEQDALTKVRKAGLGLLMAASEGRRRPAAFVEDTAVDPSVLGDYVEQFRTILDRHGLEAGWYGHCSVGCLHAHPPVRRPLPPGGRGDDARRLGGDRRVGRGVRRRELFRARRRPRAQRVQPADLRRRVLRGVPSREEVVRPAGVLNPGVMVDAERMTVHLRDAELPAPRRSRPTSTSAQEGCTPPPTAVSASARVARPASASCARPTWPRARRSTRRAAGPMRW